MDRISKIAPGPHTRLVNALLHVPGLFETGARFRVMDRFGDYTQVLTPVPGLHLGLALASAGLSTDIVACLVDFFSADHVLFATDTPFDPEPGMFVQDTIGDVEALPIDNAGREAILSANSVRVLGLSRAESTSQ